MFTIFWYLQDQNGNYGPSGERIGNYAEVLQWRESVAREAIANGSTVEYQQRKRVMVITCADGTQERHSIGNARVPWAAVGGRD